MNASSPHPWGSSDSFQFAWGRLDGDFILRARLEPASLAPCAEEGIMWRVRPSLDPEAPYVDACLHSDGRTCLHYRRTRGGVTEHLELPAPGAVVLQLERSGGGFILSSARQGEPFVSTTVSDLALGEEVYAGLFRCDDRNLESEQPRVHDLRVVRLPKPGYVPYRDYLGARLEILDVFTGRLEQIHASEEPFEAPNWMCDGRTLLYNISGNGPSRGTLRTYDLETGTERPLDTGFAIHNNNDHVLSFDGTQLAISHHADEDNGRSVIYTLPASGGVPRRITPKSPSYLHGWSPDDRWLVYTAGRRPSPEGPEKYDLYRIPSTGGEEERLTDAPGLSDGPEYSPDGDHIYFNSTRSGLMQLWRMRADGSQQEQLTDDGFNNWFPHVSPDGKWIAFLSFGQEVKPDDHPYYQRVYLRLMPTTGGAPKVIAYLFGGQGTLNVPSWSPDSTRIAFVSNTD